MKYKFMIESVELYCKEFNDNKGGKDEKWYSKSHK
jgi:hypothetical protein